MTVQQALRHEYGAGFADGVKETLAQIENRSTLSPGLGYTGPMPSELSEWLANAHRNIERETGGKA